MGHCPPQGCSFLTLPGNARPCRDKQESKGEPLNTTQALPLLVHCLISRFPQIIFPIASATQPGLCIYSLSSICFIAVATSSLTALYPIVGRFVLKRLGLWIGSGCIWMLELDLRRFWLLCSASGNDLFISLFSQIRERRNTQPEQETPY